MASVASQLIEEVTAHAQSNSLEDAREICADGTYFPNNLHIYFLYLVARKILLSFDYEIIFISFSHMISSSKAIICSE